MLLAFTESVQNLLPGVIVSSPDAAIYSVVDFRQVAKPGFSALDFVLFCASEGRVELNGQDLTLLTAPMTGFYSVPEGVANPGQTQLRIAYVESPARMQLVPPLLADLFHQYEANRS
jgi:aspartate aminotransferase